MKPKADTFTRYVVGGCRETKGGVCLFMTEFSNLDEVSNFIERARDRGVRELTLRIETYKMPKVRGTHVLV